MQIEVPHQKTDRNRSNVYGPQVEVLNKWWPSLFFSVVSAHRWLNAFVE